MNTLLRRRRLGNTSCRAIAAMSTTGINVVRNDNMPAVLPGYVFRWGCTSTIPRNDSTVVVNHSEAIHRTSDKKGFRLLLDEHELCPATWGSLEDYQQAAPAGAVVVRPAQHAQGRHVHLCSTLAEVEAAIAAIGGDYYIGEYIEKEAEYRVAVVQGRVAWVARKFPGNPEDVAWNVARGGRFENVRWDEWPLKACRYAVDAHNLSGLDFSGVDVMVTGTDVYILEINSAPSLTSPYRQECMAKCFDWIVNNGKRAIPLDDRRGDWKRWAHPALDARVWR